MHEICSFLSQPSISFWKWTLLSHLESIGILYFFTDMDLSFIWFNIATISLRKVSWACKSLRKAGTSLLLIVLDGCAGSHTDIIMEGVVLSYRKGSLSYSLIDCKYSGFCPPKLLSFKSLWWGCRKVNTAEFQQSFLQEDEKKTILVDGVTSIPISDIYRY